jgi:hypothetical protein
MNFLKYGLVTGVFSILVACGSAPTVGPNEIDPRDAAFMQASGYEIVETVRNVQANLLDDAVSLNSTNFILEIPGGEKYLVRLTFGCIEFDNNRIRSQFSESLFEPNDSFTVNDMNFNQLYTCRVSKIYRLQS